MRIIHKIAAVMDKAGEYWSILALAMVILPTFEAVILRLVFHTATLWNRELTILIFGIFFVVGYAYAESSNSHVQMDIIYSKYPVPVKMAADTLIIAICTLYCYILGTNAAIFFARAWSTMQRSESLWAPLLWPSRLSIVVGVALLWIRSVITYLERMHASIRKLKARSGKGAEKT